MITEILIDFAIFILPPLLVALLAMARTIRYHRSMADHDYSIASFLQSIPWMNRHARRKLLSEARKGNRKERARQGWSRFYMRDRAGNPYGQAPAPLPPVQRGYDE